MMRNEMLMTWINAEGVQIRLGYNWAQYYLPSSHRQVSDKKPWLRTVKLRGNLPIAVYIEGGWHDIHPT